jgi:hypothetical protein
MPVMCWFTDMITRQQMRKSPRPPSIPPETTGAILQRHREAAMSSGVGAVDRNDRRNGDRGCGDDDGDVPDILVPDPLVVQEFHITLMTLSRWTKDPRLGFPPPMKINRRNFRSRRALEEFKAGLLKKALADRAPQP